MPTFVNNCNSCVTFLPLLVRNCIAINHDLVFKQLRLLSQGIVWMSEQWSSTQKSMHSNQLSPALDWSRGPLVTRNENIFADTNNIFAILTSHWQDFTRDSKMAAALCLLTKKPTKTWYITDLAIKLWLITTCWICRYRKHKNGWFVQRFSRKFTL